MDWHAASRMRALLIGAGLCLLLDGCTSSPAPTDHYYRIDAGVPDAPAAKRLEGILQIDRLRVDALTSERQLLYQQTADATEIQQHPYHRWSDPPALLLQVELVSFLRAAGAADSVMPATTRAKADYVVAGRIRHFERVLEPKVRVVVEIEFTATSAEADEVLVNRSYREERAAKDSTVAASANAFAEAVHAVFQQFLTDLSGS